MNYFLNELTPKKNAGLELLKKTFLKYKFRLFFTILLLILSTMGSAAIPKLVEYAINTSIANKDISGLFSISIIILIVALVTAVLLYFRTVIAGFLNHGVLFDIRNSIFEKLQQLPLSFYSDNQTGDIIQRITENVSAIDRFFTQGFMRFIDIIFTIFFMLIFMLITNIKLTLITFTGLIIVFLFLIIQGRILSKRLGISLSYESKITSYAQESFDGHKTLISFNKEKEFSSEFFKKNEEYYKSMINSSKISSTSEAVMNLVSSFVFISSLYLSFIMFSRGEIQEGTILLFISYIISIFRNFSGISRMWMTIQNGIASADRISVVLDLDIDIKNCIDPHSPGNDMIQGNIEFKNVSFSYRNKKNVLESIDLKIEAGKSVAIVGPTGTGKTTFVNLIARLYDIDSGSVLLDGVDVKNWDIDKLRNQIGYLIQDTFLFEDTVINNLRYSNPLIKEKDAMKVFKELGAEKFISDLPNGLNTMLQSEGKNLSSGQRQMIALARVLLRKPKVLILDEATSQIDTKSEKIVQKAIEKATKGKTSFIIAHRLSTIFNADLIVLIQDNKILEKGSHTELLKKKGKYFEMYSKFAEK